MRERTLFHLFLVLNVALAGAFVTYLFLSRSGQPRVIATNFPTTTNTSASNNPAPAGLARTNDAKTNLQAAVPAKNSEVKTNATASAAPVKPKPTFTDRKYTWEQVEGEEYLTYLESLRAVGCPEDKVRVIVLADINELFSKKRLQAAIEHDTQWWRSEPELMMVNVLQEKGRMLEDERHSQIARLLGPEAARGEKAEALLWSSVQLTGPVLGNLPPDVHNAVQEICGRSMERHQGAFWARANEGQPVNAVEMAKLREQTRSDLRRVLDAPGMEEFLLRYSHNAHQLRSELRGFEPTPDEFRRIFRATDPIDHPLQLEYGSTDALSEKQKERLSVQRDNAIKEVLSAERYQDYLLTKDPLYRSAQYTALQYGAPPKAIFPIYQMTKLNEDKRQKILRDTTLSPQQKNEAINAVNREQMQSLQQIVTEFAAKRERP